MKILKNAVTTLLLIVLTVSLIACGAQKDLWADARYTEDTTFGTGEKTLLIEVTAGEKTVLFTIKTDKSIVGDALLEHSVIEGEMGSYGIYIKSVNGIRADFDKDHAYWSFNKNGEYLMTGVDSTEFVSGDKFELVYTKG